jgi:gluconolactonase
MNRIAFAVAALLTSAWPIDAGEEIIPAGAKLEKLWSEGEFTEGPAYGPDGCVYFSDIGNRIMKFDPRTQKTSEYRNPSGRANGLDFDPQGRLVACEGANTGGNRRITVTEKGGTIRVLADRYQGKRFNSPNDLTIDLKGCVYFTDPRYVGDEPRELNTESVYRIDTDGTVTQIIKDVTKPNGIILSRDMKTLYLAESHPRGDRLLLAYPLNADGSVGAKKVLHDFKTDRGIDGMSIDVKGNLYATAGQGKTGGVYIFTPAGKQIGFIPTPETPSNCVFGDADHKTLYVTAGRSLYRINLNAEGFAVYWPKGDAKTPKQSIGADDELNIVCDVRGKGDTALVFLHGWCGDREYWKQQVNEFAADYKVVTLDQAGHGESGKDRKNWNLNGLGSDVEAVVKALGLKRVILVGHSMGGPVALTAAKRMPGKVIAVVGVDTLQNADFKMPEEMTKKFLEAFAADFKGTLRGGLGGLLHKNTDPELKNWLITRAEVQDQKMALGLMRDLQSADTKTLLKDAKVPVRCINSAGGYAFFTPTSIDANKKYADYNAVLMEGVGHYPMLEQPAAFNQKLREVLKEFAPR